MNYEKKHKEEVIRATQLWECGDITREQLEYIFPELRESEDERIRKEIIYHIQNCDDTIDEETEKRMLAWLEKQGEQKPADKVEARFHEGDWIIRNTEGFKHNTYLVKEVKDYYVCEELKGRRVTFTFDDVHKNFKLWDISDAKDGDVLCYETKDELRIFIYKNGHIHYHCCYYNGHLTTVDSFFVVEKYLLCYIHPATKEQRDLLFQKIGEALYEWDAEKKELKKLTQSVTKISDKGPVTSSSSSRTITTYS